MSAINSNSDSEKSSRDIPENYNNISSDSFEFIEGSVYANDRLNDIRSNRPIIWSSTKEEKQKHNEEIAVMDSNFEPSSSWEKIEVSDVQKEELEACRNFLTNERSYNSHGTTRPSSKPCFIDASSLLDDDFIPVPFPRTTKIESSVDNKHGSTTSSMSYDENMHRNESRNYEIKDQYSALETNHHIPRNYRPNNTNMTSSNNREQHDEYEKHQGRLIFQNNNNNVQQARGVMANMASEDYASDISFPSEYSSSSTCGAYNNLVYDTTSGYSGSTNYSRIPSDVESMTFPDTPFNSIVQLTKKLEICSIDNNIEEDEELTIRNTSSPVQIPKRIMKHDESAPILSGGASINDFMPKHSESPAVRRKTDSCPIVSGGSFDIEDESVHKPVKNDNNDKEKLSYSWVVDLSSNNSQVDEESGCNSRQEFDEHHTPSKSSSSSTPKNSLGFYVDFSSLEPPPEEIKTIAAAKKKEDLRKQSLKKSTGYFVDFSSSSDVSSHPNTPKQNTSANTEDIDTNKRRRESESSDRSANMFNMFVDFENTSEPINKVVEEVNSSIKTDSNNDDITNVETSSTVVASSSKKGCFMFIENDCHVVKHRKTLPKEPSKRHSWNVQTNEFDDIKTNTKVYQRSTSVTSNDDKFIPASLPTVYSKTSSMSIGSSISPHEDFSCSKSLSSRSNLSISTSNTSIENSETKVHQCNDMERNLLKKRRKEAKINETYDKSSQGSVTDEIFSNEDNRTSSDTDDDLTFQNPKDTDNNLQQAELELNRRESSLLDEVKVKMDTIVETSENSSPFKKAVGNEKTSDNWIDSDLKLDQPIHTMESLQQLIEKQKQILENVAEPPIISSPPSSPFVKLSDLDKPSTKKDYPMMTTSAGFRTSLDSHQKYQSSPSDVKTMSRSTGNNIINLASSVENSKSLSRLFPHLSKVFSSSVPSNVGFNISSMDQSLYEYIEFISSDFSCTSSINSSRSGMESADESSISCRQPRRLGEDLLKMFLQEIGTDVVIDVDGRKIKAHKIILSSRCQYFAAILAGKWIENTGNIISLTGYSYNTVHFALCHVYSGAAHVPSGLDLMELASLSDCLGLEGLKEVTGYALKTNYCHNFHKPCSGCIDGIVQVLSVTLDHGFDDLYRKCLKWLCKHFCKVWVTRSFGNLTFDLMLRCSQQITAHFTSENVLNWLLDCEEVLETLHKSRWENFETQNVVEIILEAAHEYILDHFSSLIASDSFLSLGHDRKDDIPKLEHFILKAATSLSPDQACKSYPRAVRLNALLNAKLIKFPSPLSNDSFKPQFDHIQLRDEDEDIEWNDEFIKLVSALLSAVEQSLIRQCGKAMKCSAWQRMDADLRSKIQKIACVTENDDLRRNLRSSVTSLGSASSATTNRANDLRQVKLAIQAHKLLHENHAYSNKTHPPPKRPQTQKEAKISAAKHILKTTKIQHPVRDISISNSQKHLIPEDKSQNNEIKSKFTSVKARYMEPRKPRTLSEIPVKTIKKLSSSENSRDSSPAFNKKKNYDIVKKASNLSLDSLQSPLKTKRMTQNNNNAIPKKDSEMSMDSLSESLRSTSKTGRTSSESLIKRTSLNEKDSARSSARLSKGNTNPKQSANNQNQVVQQQRSFLSQKSREILAKRSQQATRKLSTNSNSSIATKSTKSSSPRMFLPINKSHSTTAVITTNKKVFNTTLHLRKTSKLPEPIETLKPTNNLNKLQKKEVPSVKLLKEKEKENDHKKGSGKSNKSNNNNNKLEEKKHENILTADPLSIEESYEVKMARSNTFSKEAPDNPIELLKSMK